MFIYIYIYIYIIHTYIYIYIHFAELTFKEFVSALLPQLTKNEFERNLWKLLI